MDEMLMLSAYLVGFVLLIVFQGIVVKKKKQSLWVALFLVEIVAIVCAFMGAYIFNSLPGYGKAPGLTYFSEMVYSILACILYAAQCLASVVIALIIWVRGHIAHAK